MTNKTPSRATRHSFLTACPSLGRNSILRLAASLALFSSHSALAANKAWSTAPTDANFGGINWSVATTGSASKTDAAATTDALFFNTSTLTALTNNLSGATFAGFTFNSGASAYTIGGSAFTLGGNITNNSSALQTINNAIVQTAGRTVTLKSGGGNLTLGGTISGAGSFTLAGTGGTLTLSGNNSFTGGILTGAVGVLRLTSNTAASTGGIQVGTYTSTDTARLELSGGITMSNLVTLGGRSNASAGILNVSGNNALTNRLDNQSGASNYYIQSDAGLLTLGTAGSNWSNSSPTGRNFYFQGAGNLAVVGILRGTDNAVIKTGAGTLTLSGTNSYTGATTVSGGKLSVSGSINGTSGVTIGTASTAAASEFNYNSSTALSKTVSFAAGSTGGTLSGTGTISTAVNVTSGNTLSIGNSPGTMNFGSSLAVGGTYLFELIGGTSTADLANVMTSLNLTGGTLSLVQLGTYTANDKFTLFAYNDALTGIFTGIADDSTFTDAGGIWKINYNDTSAGLNGGVGSSFVTITAIPEPTAALLGSLGMLVLLRRRRA